MNLTKDPIKSLFFKYLVPALGSAVVVSVYSFVDTIAVGQGVGYQGTAALAVVTPFFQAAAFFGILCGMGASVLMGVAQGTGDRARELKAFKASFYLMVFFSLAVTSLTWIFRDRVYELLGNSESITDAVHGYGDLLILIFPLMMFCSWFPFILRADRNPNLPLYSTLIGGVVNCFLDWFLVFPMNMGIFGAILATSIGYLIQFLVMAFHFISKKNTLTIRNVHPSAAEYGRIMQCGFGTAFLEAALVTTTILMNNQIQAYMNESALAIYGFLLTISSLCSHMFMGIGQASAPLLSVNYGACLNHRVLKAQKYTLVTSVIASVLFFAVGWYFPDEITILFVKTTPEIMEISAHIVRLYFISFLFMGINTTAVYCLQSVEQNTMAAVLTMFRGIVVILILLLVLPPVLGSDGIWYSVILNDLIMAVVTVFCLRASDRKLKKRMECSAE